MRPIKAVLVMGLTFSLFGCGGSELGALAVSYLVAENVSVIGTDKTIADNIYSSVSGRDCSTIRAIDGEYYCRQRLPDNRVIDTRLYCYRTLADVDCYDQAQPHMGTQQVAPDNYQVGSRSGRIVR